MGIKARFCPKCGKEGEGQGSLCLDCYSTSNQPKLPRSMLIKICPVCKSILSRYVWISSPNSLDKVVEMYVAGKVKLRFGEKLMKVKLLSPGEHSEVKVISSLDGKLVTRVLPTSLDIQKFACPQCSRQVKSSVTAKIQVRTSKDVKEFVSEVVNSIKTNKALVKAEERLYGIDLSFSDKRTARVLARRLKTKFNCSIKESVKQRGFDRMKNRPLMQSTYILRQK